MRVLEIFQTVADKGKPYDNTLPQKYTQLRALVLANFGEEGCVDVSRMMELIHSYSAQKYQKEVERLNKIISLLQIS